MIGAWPFPSKLLNAGEHVVVSTRTHVKALIVPVLVGVLLVVAVVVLSRLDRLHTWRAVLRASWRSWWSSGSWCVPR